MPVAQEKDNAALESAYTKGRLTTGEELLVNLEGQIAMRPKMEAVLNRPWWSALSASGRRHAARVFPRRRWKTLIGS